MAMFRIDRRRLRFDPQNRAAMYNDGRVRAFRVDTMAPQCQSWRKFYDERPQTDWCHMIASVIAGQPFLANFEGVEDMVRRLVFQERQRHPEVNLHAWALWPERLEIMICGSGRAQRQTLGRLRAGISRYTGGAGFAWSSETWVIPLETPSQRLRCLNELRRRALGLDGKLCG